MRDLNSVAPDDHRTITQCIYILAVLYKVFHIMNAILSFHTNICSPGLLVLLSDFMALLTGSWSLENSFVSLTLITWLQKRREKNENKIRKCF